MAVFVMNGILMWGGVLGSPLPSLVTMMVIVISEVLSVVVVGLWLCIIMVVVGPGLFFL